MQTGIEKLRILKIYKEKSAEFTDYDLPQITGYVINKVRYRATIDSGDGYYYDLFLFYKKIPS